MSSSVSLTISENQHSRIGRDEHTELADPVASNRQMFKSDQFEVAKRRPIKHQAEQHRTSGHDIRSLRAASSRDRGKLRRWNEQQNVNLDEELASNSDGFYLEVDEKMSRNSYEYPEKQAEYIERWLNTSDEPHRSRSFGDETAMQFTGNVVGIRGFSSESFLSENLKIRAEFEQLKRDHLKLQADYIELRSKLTSNSVAEQRRGNNNNNNNKSKSDDLDILKSIVLQQSKQLENIASQRGAISNACDRCRRTANHSLGGSKDELESMRFAKNQFALKLAQQEQEHSAHIETLQAELNRLRSTITSRDAELAKLKDEVSNLSLEPGNGKLLALTSENLRLRQTNEMDKHEHFVLKDNYSRLEQKLRLLVSDQEGVNNEQQEGVKEILLELCRLQVYQPKLEMILETETKIRQSLQTQLASLREEKANLADEMNSLRSQLEMSKMRASSRGSRDFELMREELESWRNKYDRLKREHLDLIELQRATKSRTCQESARLQNENQLAREACQQELEQAKSEQRRLKAQVTSLELHIGTMRNQLDEYKSERNSIQQDLLKAHRELESGGQATAAAAAEQEHVRSIANKLRHSEQTISSLERELSISNCKTKDLAGELEVAYNKLEQMKQQYNELKRRFDVQLKMFEEFKDKRDREVSKLRLDLNLEQYNRQVSLKGIEKELRSSLRELEAMKLRFSKRLNPVVGIGSAAAAAAAATTTTAAGLVDVSSSRASEQIVSPNTVTHR